MVQESVAIVEAQIADKREILEFLVKHFLMDEPLNAAAKMREVDFLPVASMVLSRCLRSTFSFVARDKETGQIVGVSLNSIWQRGEEENEYYNTKTRNDELAAAHGIELLPEVVLER
ncbi:unnamed protein product [Heligmosomoides polygyrus]|uniref:N-acetyltransferase domain-containing protein n=1 Tax=Heligmosomoides polygyrus TaxID=6339 RepID=A0A3P7XBA5_HELPZ|nr:unnamed protein product [Heligmosomoides polygyrus]